MASLASSGVRVASATSTLPETKLHASARRLKPMNKVARSEREEGSEVARSRQTVVISKERAPSKAKAESIFRRLVRREPRTVRETDESWRFAQFSPDQCKRGSYASQEIEDGVTYVWCDRREPRG